MSVGLKRGPYKLAGVRPPMQAMLFVELSVLKGEDELQREVFEAAGMRQTEEGGQERLHAWLEVSALNTIVCKKGTSLISQREASGRSLLQLAESANRVQVVKYIQSYAQHESQWNQADESEDVRCESPSALSSEEPSSRASHLTPLSGESPLQFAMRVAQKLPDRQTQRLRWLSRSGVGTRRLYLGSASASYESIERLVAGDSKTKEKPTFSESEGTVTTRAASQESSNGTSSQQSLHKWLQAAKNNMPEAGGSTHSLKKVRSLPTGFPRVLKKLCGWQMANRSTSL